MAYAIGLGHDLGHAPFGHAGEVALSKCLKDDFMHELNGYRVVEYLARQGKGLNLTFAVKDGIICHNGESFEQELEPTKKLNNLENITNRKIKPSTWEGCIVRFSDKIAYLGRDIEDAILAKLIKKSDVPQNVVEALGTHNGEIINTLVDDLIHESKNSKRIKLSNEKFELFNDLKDFNYTMIYKHKRLIQYGSFTEHIIESIFEFLTRLFCKHGFNYEGYKSESIDFAKAFGRYLKKMEKIYKDDKNVPNQILSDYISGMTDSYALYAMKQISLPKPIEF